MKAKHMTTSEKARLMSLFSANHQSSSYYDEQEILSYLPLSVSRDLSIHLYAAIICESPLFANLSTELMQRLCQVIVPQGFAEGTVVYEEGKVGDEMFFVVKGEVEVLKGFGSKRERLGFIGQGGFFGENTVIESVSRRHGTGAAVRMRTMRTTTDSELAMLRCVFTSEEVRRMWLSSLEVFPTHIPKGQRSSSFPRSALSLNITCSAKFTTAPV